MSKETATTIDVNDEELKMIQAHREQKSKQENCDHLYVRVSQRVDGITTLRCRCGAERTTYRLMHWVR